ncbi:methyltransferase domain-containing protein [Paracoccaceae bacterium Fryx2]|nr:methyltransferase domain-containing protein [Paracoccaceae bacterium Fryx2]
MASLNRIVMQKTSRRWLKELAPETLDAAEISGRWGQGIGFRSYEAFYFPKHDPCKDVFRDAAGAPRTFDIILANQVWEHLDRPYAATRNVLAMLRPGGHFWVATPFFLPFHAAPHDCSRWSARGLTNLLIEAGFPEDGIRAAQWGNRAAALRNLERPWPPEHLPETDDLTNDEAFPIGAWALARKA